ncbi:hypothetical protein H7J86_32685 [Mycobacterium hackensackense]|uniref:hypothetical protein n=1 Tax=Mycobacterium hackensackense TaxID=228909 RepID=UPI002265816E|nr:hypothetical protein [Mycobacterium hackensackense]MCV7256942.1 hypothetical protein [Mycobacterium hackensackense]
MLRAHHGLTGPADQWAGGTLVPEVSPNGPFGDGRRADAVYVGYTAASGRCLIGYEIKTSRADWRREIARAADKADQWADQCHEWWIVVSDPAIVKDGELPHGWGLMSPPTGGDHLMTVHVRAERKRDHQPSWDALRSIMSRLETLRASTIKSQIWQIEQEARRTIRLQVEAEFAKRRGPDAQELHRRLRVLEDALGLRVNWGDAATAMYPTIDVAAIAQMGAAVKEYGNITAAAEAVAARIRPSIKSLRTQLDYLDREVDDLQGAATACTSAVPAMESGDDTPNPHGETLREGQDG